MKTYICIVCGFVYDEAQGRPEEGIAAGTLWSAVPDDWACPDCGVAKVEYLVRVQNKSLNSWVTFGYKLTLWQN